MYVVLPTVRDLRTHLGPDMSELMELCNPANQARYDEEYLLFWKRAVALVGRLTDTVALAGRLSGTQSQSL